MSTAIAAARAKTKGKRLLRDALEAYGEDEYTLSEWNAIKKEAEQDGKWRWKASDTNATLAAVKQRVEKDRPPTQELQSRFATDLDAVMATELHASLISSSTSASSQQIDGNQCAWRERIGGKQYCCKNEPPPDKSRHRQQESSPDPPDAKAPARRFCLWHARECVHADHPIEHSRVIEIANEYGMCLTCYEATALKDRGTLQKIPPRLPSTRIPGATEVDLKRDALRQSLLRRRGLRGKSSDKDAGGGLSRQLMAQSVCRWEKEHSESAFVWRCRNNVLMHPTLRGAFLPFCGFHAPRCIHEYGGKKGAACPPLADRKNTLGMCRNHVEAQLATLPFETRATFVFADSEFEVPGVIECRRDRRTRTPTRHPLAPKTPPPSGDQPFTMADDLAVVVKPATPSLTSTWQRLLHQYARVQCRLHATVTALVGPAITAVINHPNPLSALLKDALWHLQFHRRAAVVATRIQCIHRGNRARRRVRAMHWEREAVRRLAACRSIQRIARGYLGRVAFAQESDALRTAVPTIQRVIRGALTRKYCRRLRAAKRIQHNYRAYRQRCLAWAMREEVAYMAYLQKQADTNYAELQVRLLTFRRLRARRVLRGHVARWRHRKAVQARLAYERLHLLLATIKVQRAFRRHQNYKRLKLRYSSAQAIQARVRGWLTRNMWKDDPGVLWVTSSMNPRSGFEYGKAIVLHQPSRSYAFPSRRIRMQCGVVNIQRVYRGFVGRMAANMRWVAMLKRWEWLQLDGATLESGDSMTLGHERYGFLLPSQKYHHDQQMHMLPIQRGVKPGRGFAYKYQSILELIQDRDGKRAWNLAREQQWQRERARQQRADAVQPVDTDHHEHKRQRKRAAHEQEESVRGKAIAISHALYPVGSVVLVASTMRRATQRFHKARVLAVHANTGHQHNDATLDVEYLASIVSVRGVRVYNEKHVPLARVRPLTAFGVGEAPPKPRRPSMGVLIKRAIDQLKSEITESQRRRYAPTDSSDEQHDKDKDECIRLPTVDAIVDRLRDENPLTDLLVDHRDFVNFVFQNVALVRIKWLQVVDHVRHGTREGVPSSSPAKPPSRAASTQPLTPSLVAFYKEFGFTTTSPALTMEKPVVPMPARAADIEQRMNSLGFLHEPSANVKEDDAIERPADPRLHTTPVVPASEDSTGKAGAVVRDDLAVQAFAATTPSTAQDLHRRIYELKTLPRERHREKIIEVTTRHVRSFVCGFPACGRFFSSHEAARLHQEGVHLDQRRLASATPLMDQYMHAYWPPQSPWNQELHRSFAPSVGYFRCSHSDCSSNSKLQFRTRRELQRHVLQAHGETEAVASRSPSQPTTSLTGANQSTPAATALRTDEELQSVIWLGAYSICRVNLRDKIPGFASNAAWHGSDAVYCETHAKVRPDLERCRECFLQRRRLVLPCRTYRSVAVPGRRRSAASQCREEVEEEEDEAILERDGSTMEGYVVFSVDDLTFCPVVRAQDVVALDEDDAQRSKRMLRQELARKAKRRQFFQDPTDVLVCLRVLTLCRDANGINWAIGHVYRPLRVPSSGEIKDVYAVVLDQSHIVAVALDDVRATCVVHRCTKEAFYASPNVRKDDPVEMRRLCEPHVGKSDAQRRIRVTIDRFCVSRTTSRDDLLSVLGTRATKQDGHGLSEDGRLCRELEAVKC